MTPRERNELIDALLDQVISEADFLRLEAELHTSRAAREAYYERLKLHTVLSAEVEAGAVLAKDRQERPAKLVRYVHPGWIAFAALLPILLGSLLWFAFGNQNPGTDTAAVPASPSNPIGGAVTQPAPPLGNEPVAHGFASLFDQTDTEWTRPDGATIALQRGDLLPAGPLHLKAGEAQIEFFSGALVSLEAGAEFEVVSAMELDMRHGTLRAHVPKPARGFLVRTPSGQLIDLGTEFSLDVTAEHSDLKVIDGEVEWHPERDQPKINLTKGSSLRWKRNQDQASPVTRFTENPERTLHKKLGKGSLKRQQAWQAFTLELRERPGILAYFSFAEPGDWQRQLREDGPGAHDGTIIRAQRTSGRWNENNALDFSPTGSRVRFNVPGTHQHLTMACWVKVNSLDRWYNSLMLTDGHELGEAHWQILENGQIHFSVKRRTATKTLSDKAIHLSPPVWTPEQSGQWMHLAVVYNSTKKVVTHYRNGKRISREDIPEDYLVDAIKIDQACLGNWAEPKRDDPAFAVRNLNGSIAEFIMFSRPLQDRDIREMYGKGRP